MSGNIKTLGELAEVFQELKDEGVSRGSMEYVTEKVFFDQETTIPRQQAPSNIWLNAFKCVRPTPEFCQSVGEQIIRDLMNSENHREGGPFRELTIRMVAS